MDKDLFNYLKTVTREQFDEMSDTEAAEFLERIKMWDIAALIEHQNEWREHIREMESDIIVDRANYQAAWDAQKSARGF
jgi:hypothetical protein